MKTSGRFLLVALLVLTGQSFGWATDTDTMICDRGMISIGATAGEVLNKCGEPATSTTREAKRYGERSGYGHERYYSTVAIDDWIFNFGPNRFQYQVVLENGRVARIRSLDYGY
jgi:hypothetical protein